MRSVIGLFPTPFMRVQGLLGDDILEPLKARALEARKQANVRTDLLSHTTMVDPKGDRALSHLAEIVTPELAQFGTLLFGEELRWTVKEMWMNVLERGGSQYVHSHANSFISGIFYLTKPHPSAMTVFHKHLSGTDFVFKNDSNAQINQFNGDKWILPEADAGDLVLYPSYLLHGVPPNQGEQRITLALNAIPDRLKSWGYEIRFSR